MPMGWAYGPRVSDTTLEIGDLRTYRIVIPPESIRRSGNAIKVMLRGSAVAASPFTIQSLYVGHGSQAVDADPYDFDGNQVQIKFNGSTTIALDYNDTAYSDTTWFNLQSERPLVVAAYVRCSAVRLVQATLRGVDGPCHYYRRNINDAHVTDAFGYTGPINSAPFVFSIEAPEHYSTTTSTSTCSSTTTSTGTTQSGWTTTSSTQSSTTSTTVYVPDADAGFEHEDITEIFVHESITNTFTHPAIDGWSHEEVDPNFIHDIISNTWREVIVVSDRKPSMEVIYKQPLESFPIYADFVNVLVTDETIVIGSSSVVVTDVNGTSVTTDMVEGLSVQDTTKLKTQLKAAGTEAASPYKVTFKAVTSLGNTYEIDGKVRVVNL